MSIKSSFTKILTKFCEQGVTDRANFLKNAAVVGWALSSLAQTCAIFFNEKMPAKEKRFLIPQEIFDGIINATLFWFITSKTANFGKMLALKKHVVPKSLSKVLENYTPNGTTIEKLKDGFLSHVKSFGTQNDVKTAANLVEGLGVAVGLAGAIVSNNIITPVLRNKFAGMWQQKELKKINDNSPLNPYYGKDYKKYDFAKSKKPVNFGNYTGGMRV